MIEIVDQLDAYDPVASELISTRLIDLLSVQSIITHVNGSDEFRSTSAINSKRQDIITPEELSSLPCIGLNKASHNPKATTHKYIHTTCLLEKRFHTDKEHIRYKQLSRQ